MIKSEEQYLDYNEDIAIIGMSGRFPGANNIQQFWQNIRDGLESISFFSEEELLASGVKAELLNNPNYVRASSCISDPDKFDASFFGYSPKEATEMDPQQRIFLECAWEAIEGGGYNPYSYEGAIGVYAGCSINSYLINNFDSQTNLGLQIYLKGGDKDYLATRVAYHLNLKGPAMSIQTACSTSLVAVHMACQSLLNGECNMTLAGGVSIALTEGFGYLYEEGLVASPDGHCRAFDASAKGTVPGSGVGVVLLKSLEDAIADGDYIYAIIKGSAINNDGSLKVGYTAPSVKGQAAVISEALTVAEVEPETITYVEAHGTGTPLGDPIEIAALTKAFSEKTLKRGFCAIGSVKTNVGHLVTAAGITGLIKAVLCLKHKEIPPSLNFEQPNPKIDFLNSPFYVNTTLSPWVTQDKPRRAGVSSFGVGGTNAHVILEEAPEREKEVGNTELSAPPLKLLTLSAKTEKALAELVSNYHDHLQIHSQLELTDICYTAAIGRAHFSHRLALIAANTEQLKEKLAQHQREENVPSLISGNIYSPSDSLKVVFLFTGQGSQYTNMGKQLYQTQPVFREVMDYCDQILSSELEHSLLSVLYPNTEEESIVGELINQTAYTQPALFVIEYALAQLWQSWGIKPDAVMGHSVGEYVAATIAGIMSLEDGLKLIAARGRLMQKLPSGGGMVAVMADEDKVSQLISGYEAQVAIAAMNGPENTVISGKKEDIEAICSQLELEQIKYKPLEVSHAFHSPLMEPILAEFAEIADQISYQLPQIPLISNLTGEPINCSDNSSLGTINCVLKSGEKLKMSEYWVKHIHQPIRFVDSTQSLDKLSYNIFLEIGPKPILLGMGKRCIGEDKKVWLSSLRPIKEDLEQMLLSLGNLYVQGCNINYEAFYQDSQAQKVVLPTYPFQRQRYWLKTAKNSQGNGFIAPEIHSSEVFNLINQGKTKLLREKLAKVAKFSAKERELLPKLLDVIVKQHQQPLFPDNPQEKNSFLEKDKAKETELIREIQTISAEEGKQKLIKYLQNQINQFLQTNLSSNLDLEKSILELGFDSLNCFEFKRHLEPQLEITIPANKILIGPSIIELAEELYQLLRAKFAPSEQTNSSHYIRDKNSWIAYYKPKTNSFARLICFHPWGSSASIFKEWSDQLSEDIEVLPIQLPGRQQLLQEKPFTEFSNLIKVLENFLTPYLDKPFAFYGHSMGALIAFELTYVLEQKYNLQPLHVFLGGVQPPSDASFLDKIQSLSEEEMFKSLLDISEIPEEIYQDQSFQLELINVLKADVKLLKSYRHLDKKPLSCPLYLFAGQDDSLINEEQLSKWSKYTTNTFKKQFLPGKHMFLNNSQKSLLNIIQQEILP